MTIKASGQLALSEIAAEFGGTPPYSLSNYYRGGGLVPDTPGNANIPVSGQIKFSDFYGASNVVTPAQTEASYLSPGDYTLIIPAGVFFISGVAVGGGGGGVSNTWTGSSGPGGGGGALAYANDIPVSPGDVVEIHVGAGGTANSQTSGDGGDSWIKVNGVMVVQAGGGKIAASTSTDPNTVPTVPVTPPDSGGG